MKCHIANCLVVSSILTLPGGAVQNRPEIQLLYRGRDLEVSSHPTNSCGMGNYKENDRVGIGMLRGIPLLSAN